MAESSESLGGWSNGSKRKTQLLQKGTFDSIEEKLLAKSLQTTLLYNREAESLSPISLDSQYM